MKKYISLLFVLILSLLLLTACGCEHQWEDADCNDPKACEKCGKTEGEALGHRYQEATCEEPQTCAACGRKKGDALGHSWVDATCEAPKTCKTCNKTEGDALGHDADPATCEGASLCKTCKKEVAPATGHSWVDATCQTPKTCSVCKMTDGSVAGHTWTDATCETPKTCTACRLTDGNVLGHEWAEATCQAPKTCTRCQKTQGTVLDHDWTAATCQAPKTCAACQKTEGDVLDHNWVKATCETPKTCSMCQATEGEPSGHWWNDASCVKPKTCIICRKVEGTPLGHSFAAPGADGVKTCTVCQGSLDSAILGKYKLFSMKDRYGTYDYHTVVANGRGDSFIHLYETGTADVGDSGEVMAGLSWDLKNMIIYDQNYKDGLWIHIEGDALSISQGDVTLTYVREDSEKWNGYDGYQELRSLITKKGTNTQGTYVFTKNQIKMSVDQEQVIWWELTSGDINIKMQLVDGSSTQHVTLNYQGDTATCDTDISGYLDKTLTFTNFQTTAGQDKVQALQTQMENAIGSLVMWSQSMMLNYSDITVAYLCQTSLKG